MKFSHFYALLLGIFLFGFNAKANIFRVNSSLTTDASQKLYQTITEAVTAATAGDTLMIEGSGVLYANATINKTLVLIGPGYLLAQNPQTQANTLPASVTQITITASNTVLEGLTFSTDYSNDAPYIQANDVIITRCYCPYTIHTDGNLNGLLVLENYFVSTAITVDYSNNSLANVLFNNNYVGGSISITSSDEEPRIFSSVENNIFASSLTLTSLTFRSNIITNSSATITVSSAHTENNLVAGTQLIGNGNQTYNSAQLFVGATGNSTDGQYKLQSTSPYLAAGYGGIQPGIFGGSEPYILSGLPPVPSIYELDGSTVANKQTGLSIELKVKANQ